MAKAKGNKAPARAPRGKDANPRKYKKKTSPLIIDKVEYVDYKDVDLLSRFMSDRAKIRNARVAGNDRQQQRWIGLGFFLVRSRHDRQYADSRLEKRRSAELLLCRVCTRRLACEQQADVEPGHSIRFRFAAHGTI